MQRLTPVELETEEGLALPVKDETEVDDATLEVDDVTLEVDEALEVDDATLVVDDATLEGDDAILEVDETLETEEALALPLPVKDDELEDDGGGV